MFTRIRFSVTLNGKPLTDTHMGFTKFSFTSNENDLLLIPNPSVFPLDTKLDSISLAWAFSLTAIWPIPLPRLLSHYCCSTPKPPPPNLEFITHSPSLYWHLCWLSLLVKVFHILTYSLQICTECLILWGWRVRCWRHRPETWMRPCGVGLRLTCI